MTQTANGRKNTPAKTPQRTNRPGQRQQERLMRLARRRRRQHIWASIIIAAVLLALAGLGFWQYQRIQAQNAASLAAKDATATAAAPIGPACATASSTPPVYASTPKAGPTGPPPATGAPAKNADGLKCLDLKVGSGAEARPGSNVTVEYTGWLQSNGKKFDSSYDRGGQSFSVSPLGQAQVIQGWNEGLVGMKVDGTRRLIIPPSLGYGAQANQGIPANSTLIFDITVLRVQ